MCNVQVLSRCRPYALPPPARLRHGVQNPSATRNANPLPQLPWPQLVSQAHRVTATSTVTPRARSSGRSSSIQAQAKEPLPVAAASRCEG